MNFTGKFQTTKKSTMEAGRTDAKWFMYKVGKLVRKRCEVPVEEVAVMRARYMCNTSSDNSFSKALLALGCQKRRVRLPSGERVSTWCLTCEHSLWQKEGGDEGDADSGTEGDNDGDAEGDVGDVGDVEESEEEEGETLMLKRKLNKVRVALTRERKKVARLENKVMELSSMLAPFETNTKEAADNESFGEMHARIHKNMKVTALENKLYKDHSADDLRDTLRSTCPSTPVPTKKRQVAETLALAQYEEMSPQEKKPKVT